MAKTELYTVDDLLAEHSPGVVKLVQGLRRVVKRSAPRKVHEKAHPGWKNITYELDGMVCYIAPTTNYAHLGFYRGVYLQDPEGLLEGDGRYLRHLKVHSGDNLQQEPLSQLVEEAFTEHSEI